MNKYLDRQSRAALAVFCLIALWDASRLDTALAQLAGSHAGFPLRVSHWAGWLRADGGGGHCFATGFAFMGGYFALRADKPRLARIWLAASIALGLLLGAAQQLRGAHFMSHTLWTGWICWLFGWATDILFSRHVAPAQGAR